MKTVGALDYSQVDAGHANWQRADNNWMKRAARGSGRGGGLKSTRTSYFYGTGFFPFGRTWGGIFAPTQLCPLAPPPVEPPPCDNPFGLFCPPPGNPGDPTPPTPNPGNGQPPRTPKP